MIAAWLFWLVHRSLDGQAWFDGIVRTVLDEFILSVALFAVALLIWATWKPAWLTRVLSAAHKKLVWAVALMGLFFGAALVLSAVAAALLEVMGAK
ncbi:MAG: hypothetical protein NUV77_24495 [Thermoguttaceae bacterium]|nr:hypothetical protein [Thermoguttaceae bacterium]